MWVSSFRNSLSSIPHLLGLWHGACVAGGQIVDGSGQQKKRPGGRFSLSATPSDVCVLDLRRLVGLVVVPGAHAHPDGQLVYDADDRQQEQEEDQGAADVKANAGQPENREDRDDRPDQTCQRVYLRYKGPALIMTLYNRYHLFWVSNATES